MLIDDMGDSAEVSIVPEDLNGVFDYIPDVKSMSAGAQQEMAQARQQALELFTTNNNVLQLMAQEGYKPSIRELMISTLEDMGLRDAERFFIKVSPQEQAQATAGAVPGSTETPQVQGLSGAPQADSGVSLSE
jgi:hypothetical protein